MCNTALNRPIERGGIPTPIYVMCMYIYMYACIYAPCMYVCIVRVNKNITYCCVETAFHRSICNVFYMAGVTGETPAVLAQWYDKFLTVQYVCFINNVMFVFQELLDWAWDCVLSNLVIWKRPGELVCLLK